MTYSIYSKERNSLQFPVMCNGYVQIKTADAYSTEPTGIWDYQGPFTLEMIVTPYEVNGMDNPYSASYNENSQKSLPRDSAKGRAYLSSADRHNVEMCLFHNTNLTLSLVNKTTTAVFQPAEYALKASITIGGTTTTLESPIVFKSEIVDKSYSNPTNYVYQNHLPVGVETAATVVSVNQSTGVVTVDDGSTLFSKAKYFTNTGLLIGQSNTLSLAVGNDDLAFLPADQTGNWPANSTKLYRAIERDVLYTETSHHVALSFGNQNIYLFYNGQLVATGKHGSSAEFQLDSSDIFIGRAGSSAANTTQFMGEIHEIGFYKEIRRHFRETSNIIPPFRTTLLFMDFEEATL